jgi:hypothetical protein
VFIGPKLPKTHSNLIVGATNMVKRDITPTDAPIRELMLISPLQLHLSLPVEPTLFLLLPSRTMPMGESIMWPWKKHKKLMMLSLVCFSSMTLLQLCCLILECHIFFVSAAYVGKHNLPLALLKCQMIVSSLGGDMPARQLCLKVNLEIRGGRLCRQPHYLGIEGC